MFRSFGGRCCLHIRGDNYCQSMLEVTRKKEICRLGIHDIWGRLWVAQIFQNLPFYVLREHPLETSNPEDGVIAFRRNTGILNHCAELKPQVKTVVLRHTDFSQQRILSLLLCQQHGVFSLDILSASMKPYEHCSLRFYFFPFHVNDTLSTRLLSFGWRQRLPRNNYWCFTDRWDSSPWE